MRTHGRPNQLSTTLEQLRHAIDYDLDTWTTALKLKKSQYRDIVRRSTTITLPTLVTVAERFNLSLQSLYSGEIDLEVFKAHQTGDLGVVPARYRVAAHSRIRSTIASLEYLNRFHGPSLRTEILRHLQVTETALLDPDGAINVFLPVDIFSILKRSYRFQESQFTAMGHYSFIVNQAPAFTSAYRSVTLAKHLYERMFGDLLKIYERNCTYHLKELTNSICVVDCYSNQEVTQLLKTRHIGTRETCLWKAGLFTTAPQYLKLPYATVQETECVHLGDRLCRYRINFSDAYRNFHQRIHQAAS